MINEGEDFRKKDFFSKRLQSISRFDWSAETSPLVALGGMKGVSKAYDMLSKVVGQEKFSANPAKPLGDFCIIAPAFIDMATSACASSSFAFSSALFFKSHILRFSFL